MSPNNQPDAADPDFDQDYWDRTWDGDTGSSMSTAPPNPHLVTELTGLTPGTALDAGCGAGAEAIWLARNGWQTTAADIAEQALDHARRRAADAAQRIDFVCADLSIWQPGRTFDLVTSHYAHPSIGQLEFYDRLGEWVAPGGTLLIVGHGQSHNAAHHHSTGHTDGHHHTAGHTHTPDAATVTADAVAARFAGHDWTVLTAAQRRRKVSLPDGRQVDLDDVVVQVRRR